MTTSKTPILCFIGRSNCGKTTLVAQVVAELCSRGFLVGALKHASHGFHMDKPGKDTFHFREAGAHAIGIASDTERAVITTTERPTTLHELAAALPDELDIIICEGFASYDAPKIGVHRDESPLPAGLDGIVAVVGESMHYEKVPTFQAADVSTICDHTLMTCGLPAKNSAST